MRDKIKNGVYNDMTSLIKDAITRVLKSSQKDDEKIYDLNSLADLENSVAAP